MQKEKRSNEKLEGYKLAQVRWRLLSCIN
jgi:hypothetical protein